jgi:hypothetical protein
MDIIHSGEFNPVSHKDCTPLPARNSAFSAFDIIRTLDYTHLQPRAMEFAVNRFTYEANDSYLLFFEGRSFFCPCRFRPSLA